MDQSDYFEFEIQNLECEEIAGKFGQENIYGISFDIFLMESCVGNNE